MVLFPESRRFVEAAADDVPMYSDGFDIAAARAEARAAALAEPREDVAEVRDLDCDGVPARLYRPATATATATATASGGGAATATATASGGGAAGASGSGLVVHLHGGGFVFHDVDVHDPSARRLANRTGMAVLSVDYRRPPEHRFPAAPDDVDTVLAWLDREGEAAGLSGPVFAHGDSAGANLALGAALRHPGRFHAVALVYPFLDPTAGFESYAGPVDGFDPRTAAWYWQQYAVTPADLEHPDLAPLRSDRLASLPPTLVVTAEHDPLRDEGEHLARLLAEAGVEVVATRYLGQVHGFWRHPSQFPAAEPLMGQVAAYLRMQACRPSS